MFFEFVGVIIMGSVSGLDKSDSVVTMIEKRRDIPRYGQRKKSNLTGNIIHEGVRNILKVTRINRNLTKTTGHKNRNSKVIKI